MALGSCPRCSSGCTCSNPGQARPRELPLDVREVPGAPVQPEDDLVGIPDREWEFPLEPLRDVPASERPSATAPPANSSRAGSIQTLRE
jgi:hypothetical protein